MPKHNEVLDLKRLSMDEVIAILAEKSGKPVYQAKRDWKYVMETIHDLLVGGRPVLLTNIGRIVIAKSQEKLWIDGRKVGGNYIPKMEFSDNFRMEMRNAEVDEVEVGE